ESQEYRNNRVEFRHFHNVLFSDVVDRGGRTIGHSSSSNLGAQVLKKGTCNGAAATTISATHRFCRTRHSMRALKWRIGIEEGCFGVWCTRFLSRSRERVAWWPDRGAWVLFSRTGFCRWSARGRHVFMWRYLAHAESGVDVGGI